MFPVLKSKYFRLLPRVVHIVLDLLQLVLQSLELELCVSIRLKSGKRFAHTAPRKGWKPDLKFRVFGQRHTTVVGVCLFSRGGYFSRQQKGALVFGGLLVSSCAKGHFIFIVYQFTNLINQFIPPLIIPYYKYKIHTTNS